MLSNRQLFLRHLAQTSVAPLSLEIERAASCFLYDTEGKAYLDLIAGIGVSCLGHRHPAVEAAVREQTGKYWHTLVYGEFILSPQVQLASLLAAQTPGLDAVFLVNSGAEAVEGAMKLAKRCTGRPGFVACRFAYHGSTQGAASLMSDTAFTLPFHPLLPGIRHIGFDDEADLLRIDRHTAAVIVETVQAESGIRKARPAWWRALRARCDETGALLILDEIQSGYGRTGTLFAYEQYGMRPDILLLAKGFGGGMPIGAFLAPRHIMETLAFDPPLGHITTFGGHPVSAAAALATLQTLLASNLIAEVPEKERLFRNLLVHPAIREVRSAGLWLAVDLGDPAKVQRSIRYCLDHGVITDWFLFNDRSLRIAPPLIISETEIKTACAVIVDSLNAH